MTDDDLCLAFNVVLRTEGPDSASLPELAEMALGKLKESQARVAELQARIERCGGWCREPDERKEAT
jgi:hypothetical protein